MSTTERARDTDDIAALQAAVASLTSAVYTLAGLVSELAVHAYWAETRAGHGCSTENLVMLREISDHARGIVLERLP